MSNPQCPSIMKFNQNPITWKGEYKDIFGNEISKTLWCCISYGHVRDQYMNGEVIKTSRKILKKQPTTYQEFIEIILNSYLSNYGRLNVDNNNDSFCNRLKELSNIFWKQVWVYIKNILYPKENVLPLFPKENKKLVLEIHYKSRNPEL